MTMRVRRPLHTVICERAVREGRSAAAVLDEELTRAFTGRCPKATCSAAGLVGGTCPLHPNLRFKAVA